MVFKRERFDVRLFNPESSFSSVLKFLFLILFLKDNKQITDILDIPEYQKHYDKQK